MKPASPACVLLCCLGVSAAGEVRTCTENDSSCRELDACASAHAQARSSAAEASAWREAAEQLNATVAELGAEVESLRLAHATAVREQAAAGVRLEELQAATSVQIDFQIQKAKSVKPQNDHATSPPTSQQKFLVSS